MTVDVDPPSPSNPRIDIEKGVEGLVELFDRYQIDATFFITANIAERFPGAIKRICTGNHEIACHGLDHVGYECLKGKEEQRRRVRLATEILTSATGHKPAGFRAPGFRFNSFCFEVLQENGYVYDSSIVPTYVPGEYGRPLTPSTPYFLTKSSTPKISHLVELPVAVNPLIPFPLGGAWMRTLGLSWTKLSIKTNFILGRHVVFHIHPKDVIYALMEPWAPWYYHRNTKIGMKMLEDLIKYVKKIKGQFAKAGDDVESFIRQNSRE
jgi:peptidoglycan/xylan/chitin deacetylase (PgdA/CDA1 family)